MKARWTVADEVVEAFDRCPKRERLQLLSYFASVTDFPDNSADHTLRGPKGRLYLVAYRGGWALTYWIDAVGDYVHFVEIEKRVRRR